MGFWESSLFAWVAGVQGRRQSRAQSELVHAMALGDATQGQGVIVPSLFLLFEPDGCEFKDANWCMTTENSVRLERAEARRIADANCWWKQIGGGWFREKRGGGARRLSWQALGRGWTGTGRS